MNMLVIDVRFRPAIPASGKLKQENCNEFQASLGPEGGGRRKEDCLAIQGNNDYKCKFSPCVLFIVETGSDYVPLACLKLAV